MELTARGVLSPQQGGCIASRIAFTELTRSIVDNIYESNNE